jgi:hypothetical protein
MVTIALGPPDKVLPITGREGQKQTVWTYHTREFLTNYDPLDPDSIYHQEMRSIEQTVIFHDGVVARQDEIAIESGAGLAESPARRTAELQAGLAEFQVWPPKSPARRTAENMEARLDRLVALMPEQKVKARDIIEKANEVLLAFSPEERTAKGRPIRVRMRADIWAILTPEQQAKYDAAPQYLGGGSTKRQPRQVDSSLSN